MGISHHMWESELLSEDLHAPSAFLLLVVSVVVWYKSNFWNFYYSFCMNMSENCSFLEWPLTSSSFVCLCREGWSSGSAGQCTSGRQRALCCSRGDGEACCVQGANRRASALLQLCEHAETRAGQCCVSVATSTGSWKHLESQLSIPCVQDHEINMLGEVTHLQTILEDLINLTAEPNKLPPSSEQV